MSGPIFNVNASNYLYEKTSGGTKRYGVYIAWSVDYEKLGSMDGHIYAYSVNLFMENGDVSLTNQDVKNGYFDFKPSSGGNPSNDPYVFTLKIGSKYTYSVISNQSMSNVYY